MKQRGAHETGISWSGSPCVRECFILSLWVFKASHLWNTVFNPYSLSLWSYIKLPYVVLIFLPGEITPQWVFFCCASEEFLQSGLEIQSCPHLLWAELLPQWNLCFANAKASCSLESSQYRSHLSDLSFLPPTLHIQNPRFSNDILLREEIFFFLFLFWPQQCPSVSITPIRLGLNAFLMLHIIAYFPWALHFPLCPLRIISIGSEEHSLYSWDHLLPISPSPSVKRAGGPWAVLKSIFQRALLWAPPSLPRMLSSTAISPHRAPQQLLSYLACVFILMEK